MIQTASKGVFIPWPGAALAVTILLGLGAPGIAIVVTQARLGERVSSLASSVEKLSNSVSDLAEQVKLSKAEADESRGETRQWRIQVERRVDALEAKGGG